MRSFDLFVSRVTAGRMKLAAAMMSAVVLTGCATPKAPFDYTAFKSARPASILILPPINESPDIKATPAVMASTVLPLAEAGYYVLPVTLVSETFMQNGMTSPEDIHQLGVDKLRGIFGADAALYVKVKRYGTSYFVIGSETTVSVEAKIVDLRNGAELWHGTASASSAESNNNTGGGVAGLLVAALVKQVIGTATDAGYNYAAIANQRLLGAPVLNGVLYGPRSPSYQKD